MKHEHNNTGVLRWRSSAQISANRCFQTCAVDGWQPARAQAIRDGDQNFFVVGAIEDANAAARRQSNQRDV